MRSPIGRNAQHCSSQFGVTVNQLAKLILINRLLILISIKLSGWVELMLALLHSFWMSNIIMHVCPYSAVMRLILWLSICVLI